MMLLLALAVGVLAIYLVVQAIRPLVETSVVTSDDWARVEDESAALLHRRDRLVAELRELEFEAAMHKIDARDLEALRARYEAEAVEVVRRLDERAEAYETRIDADVKQTIGAARARKAGKAPPEPSQPVVPAAEATGEAPAARCNACEEPLEVEAAFCDHCGAAQGPACPECSQHNRPSARFCKGCGHGLEKVSA